MPAKDRKAREFQRREDDILLAALALSNTDDWQSVTIDQIAKKAEIGKGTVYKHFKTKDDVYARLAASFHHMVLERLWELDRSRSALRRVRDVLSVCWEMYSTHQEYQRVVEYCERPDFKRRVSPDLRRATQSLEAGFAEVVYDIMTRGVAEGALQDRPPALMLFCIQSALVGAMKLRWTGALVGSPDQYLEELTAFVLAGLVRRPSRADGPVIS